MVVMSLERGSEKTMEGSRGKDEGKRDVFGDAIRD